MLQHDNYIMHFNKNHDPKTGKFTKGPGSSISKSNVKNQNVKNKISNEPNNEPTKPTNVSELSDDELRKKLNRLRMEDEYKRLTKSDLNKQGSNYLKNLIPRIADKTIFTLLGSVLGVAGKRLTKIL